MVFAWDSDPWGNRKIVGFEPCGNSESPDANFILIVFSPLNNAFNFMNFSILMQTV